MSVEQDILNRYGYMGAFLNHPEVGPLLKRAAAGGWTKEVLQGELFKTRWYQTTQATGRQWQLLKSSDPAEANRIFAEKQHAIFTKMQQMGINIPIERLGQITEMALQSGADDTLLNTWIGAEAQFKGDQQKPGSILQMQQKVQALAYDQMLPMSAESAFNYAKQIAQGVASEETVTSALRQQAISRFPQFATELNHGVSMKQIAAPYAEQAAQLLEIGPETVDMTNQKFARMIDTRDDTGAKTSMSLSDAATYIRGLSEWQYTQNAHEEAAAMAENIAKTFGKVG